jgi:hypothetical protein
LKTLASICAAALGVFKGLDIFGILQDDRKIVSNRAIERNLKIIFIRDH